MTDILIIYANLFYVVFLFIILILFVYQSIRKGRSAPYFTLNLIFGTLGALFLYLDLNFPPNGVDLIWIFSGLFFGLQYIFFFLFTERMRSLKINALRWSPNLWEIMTILYQFSGFYLISAMNYFPFMYFS